MKAVLKPLGLFIVAIQLLIGCEARDQQDREIEGDEVATTTARTDQRAEEQAIRELDRRWLEANQAKDADAIAALFAEDGITLYAGERIEGPQAIRADAAEAFQKYPSAESSFEPTKIVVSEGGDMAYDIGTFEGTREEDGRQIEDKGFYVTVWKKMGGEWKVAVDITSDEPPTGDKPE